MKLGRLKELFRYFRAASNAASLKYEDVDLPGNYQPDDALLSTDIILNALLQNIAQRLNCDRAFVSLIDDEYQFIIAEATKTVSLVDASTHDQDDQICIGTKPLTLTAGICASTMPAFTQATATDGPSIYTANVYADSTRYVINDLSLDDRFKTKPYVVGYPHMRWYAEVPLRTTTGHAIGSLAVVDNSPHSGLRDEEYRIMFELASAIMRHLEMLRISAEHSRAVNLLNGLDKFMHQRSSLPLMSRQDRLPSTSSHQVGELARSTSISLAATLPAAESSNTESLQSSRTVETATTSATLETTPSSYIDPTEDIHSDPSVSSPTHTPTRNDIDLGFDEAIPTHQEARINIFSSAAALLREASDLDGVVFFDAAPTMLTSGPKSPLTSSSLTSGYFDSSNPGVSGFTSESQDDPAPEQNLSQSEPQSCKRLGHAFSAGKTSPVADIPDDKLLLPVTMMQNLLHLFPKGTIFNLEHPKDTETSASGPEEASDTTSPIRTASFSWSTKVDPLERLNIEKELRSFLRPGRSIIFHPLWNSQTENWYAACLAWSNDSRRVLQSSDLSYITAFSNSVMAEVVNLELLAIDNAKSDFISSISHEVRSPLHGILGSAEILADVVVDKEQRDLVEIVENCGRNLLETVDNILHFSKINSKARAMEKPGTPQSDRTQRAQDYEASTDVSKFNIGKLVENTVESLIVSHQHSTALSATMASHSDITSNISNKIVTLTTESKVVVILRISYQESWMVKSRIAVWQRILMNLLGNAMKYTYTGYIEIDLSAAPQDGGSGSSLVTLVVRDTGKGISQSYLNHRLYQPFVQEDTLSPGTGLGLSIVKGLVGELQGEISIRSTQGVGTEVTVSIPVTFVADKSPGRPPFNGDTLCLLGFDAYPELDAVPTGGLPVNVRRALALKDALKSTCEDWLSMTVTYTNNRSEAEANIIIVMEDDVHLFKCSPSAPGLQTLDIPRDSALVLLCADHTTKEKLAYHEQAAGVHYLSQPFGPIQLARVVAQIRASVGQTLVDKQQSQHTHRIPIPHSISKPTPMMMSDGVDTEKLVLLVEDNSVNLQLLVRSMQKIGRRYLTAADGQQALEVYQARNQEIDHVFMDISMPVMDGFMSTREIRAFEKQQSIPRIPITMLTGLGSDTAREEAVNCGSDRFLVKPVRLAMLKSLLDGAERHDKSSGRSNTML